MKGWELGDSIERAVSMKDKIETVVFLQDGDVAFVPRLGLTGHELAQQEFKGVVEYKAMQSVVFVKAQELHKISFRLELL